MGPWSGAALPMPPALGTPGEHSEQWPLCLLCTRQCCQACLDARQEMLTLPFLGCWEVEEDFAVLCWGGGEMHSWKPKYELAQRHLLLSNAGPSTARQLEGEAPGRCGPAGTPDHRDKLHLMHKDHRSHHVPSPCPQRIYELRNQCSNSGNSRLQEEERRSDSPSREGTLPGGNDHKILQNTHTTAAQLGKHRPACGHVL